MIKSVLVSVTAVLSVQFAGHAQESESSPPPTPAQLAAGLSGDWVEIRIGRLTEEIWTTAEGSLMVGMRRTRHGGSPIQVEYMTLALPEADIMTQWIARDPPRTLNRLPSSERSAELHFKAPHAPYTQVLYTIVDTGFERTISDERGSTPMGVTTYSNAQLMSMDSDFGWVSGHWRQETATGFSEEIWSETGGGALSGLNRTISGSETVAFEFMEITQEPDLNTPPRLTARPQGGDGVVFELVDQGPRSASFANESNAFPTHIRYSRDGDTLTARIWGQDGEAQGREWVWTRVE